MDKDVAAQSRAEQAAKLLQPADDSSLSAEENRPSPRRKLRAAKWRKEGKDSKVEELKLQHQRKLRKQTHIVEEMVAKAVEDAEALDAERKRSALLEEENRGLKAKRARRGLLGEETSEEATQKLREDNRVLSETLRATQRAMEEVQRRFREHMEDDGTGLSKTPDEEGQSGSEGQSGPEYPEGQSGPEEPLPGGAGNSMNSVPETASRVIAGGGVVKFAVQVDPLQSLMAKDCVTFLAQAQLQNTNQAGFLWHTCVIAGTRQQFDLLQQTFSRNPTQPWQPQFGIDHGHWSEWDWSKAEKFFLLHTATRQGGKTEDIPGQVWELLKGTDPQDLAKTIAKFSESMTFVRNQELSAPMHQQVITKIISSLEDCESKWKKFHKKLASDVRAKGWKALKNSEEFLQNLYDLYTQRMKILAEYEEFGLGEGGKQSAATQDPPRDQRSSREKSQKTQGNKGGGKYWVETADACRDVTPSR